MPVSRFRAETGKSARPTFGNLCLFVAVAATGAVSFKRTPMLSLLRGTDSCAPHCF